MDKYYFLKLLEDGLPLFDTWMAPQVKRIMGFEIEFGVKTETNKNGIEEGLIERWRLPVIPKNGGRIYVDMAHHVEYCTPEVSNPLSAVAYYEAGKRMCFNMHYSPELFCNSTDWHNTSFASHENYFTRLLKLNDRLPLVPFLVARTILCGAGWQNDNFRISQRAQYIKKIQSDSTTENRAIVNTRRQPLANIPHFDRLHIICGDSNVSEISSFLRMGLTNLIIELAEMGALPNIRYSDRDEVVLSDLNSISNSSNNWVMVGIENGPKGVIDLLGLYLKIIEREIGERDKITSALIVVFSDTLNKLSKDIYLLKNRLDWVIKKVLIEQNGENDEWRKRAIDLAYHNVNPEFSLYHGLLASRQIERVVSEEMIRTATLKPPNDTRAYIRGSLAFELIQEGRGREIRDEAWDFLAIVDENVNRPNQKWPPGKKYWEYEIDNPFCNYSSLSAEIRDKIRKGRI